MALPGDATKVCLDHDETNGDRFSAAGVLALAPPWLLQGLGHCAIRCLPGTPTPLAPPLVGDGTICRALPMSAPEERFPGGGL